jgi:hypothetical protein
MVLINRAGKTASIRFLVLPPPGGIPPVQCAQRAYGPAKNPPNPRKMADIMLEKLDQKRPYLLKTLKHGIVPLFFYFLSFSLLTYPLILKFSTNIFGDKGDGIQNIWNLWWVNLSVLRPDLHPTIWQTNMLHWPFGITLYAQTLNPFNGYLAVFLLRFLSLIATNNTIKIFAFVMAGLTMYWFS